MVGPSSLGVLNTAAEVSLNATFTGASVRAGGLAICSPSGAVGIGLLGHAAARQLGVSMFASLGNRADVSTNDLLECWEQDARTAAVVLYVESFGSPERFTRIARRVSPPQADPGGQGASTGRAGAQRGALAHGGGAAWRRGRRRAVVSSRGAAVPQWRGAVRRRRVLRAPAAADRAADRDPEQLRGGGDARRRRVCDARAGSERDERGAESSGLGDQRRTG